MSDPSNVVTDLWGLANALNRHDSSRGRWVNPQITIGVTTFRSDSALQLGILNRLGRDAQVVTGALEKMALTRRCQFSQALIRAVDGIVEATGGRYEQILSGSEVR